MNRNLCFTYDQVLRHLEFLSRLMIAKIKNVVTILPYKAWRELIIKLDPLSQLGGDYKDLASEIGYDMEKILYFQSGKI